MPVSIRCGYFCDLKNPEYEGLWKVLNSPYDTFELEKEGGEPTVVTVQFKRGSMGQLRHLFLDSSNGGVVEMEKLRKTLVA